MKKMKNLYLSLLFSFLSIAAFSQGEETRKLDSFSEIAVQEGVKVYLSKGSKEEARIVSENVDIEDVLTEVNGSRLKIHLDGNRWGRVDVKVYIKYRSLEGLSASSAGSIKVEDEIDASGADFDLDVSSSGSIEATILSVRELKLEASSSGNADLKIEADEIKAQVSSSGELEVSGKVQYQRVQASSSGRYKASDLESEEADASASSAGSVRVNVSKKLDASASSGGSVRYSGSPEYLSSNSSSGGSVRKS